MTSLDRARAHLRYEQSNLSVARYNFGHGYLEDKHLRKFEDAFLAALSWVWEEQTRASLGDDPYNIGYAKGFHDAEYMECQ